MFRNAVRPLWGYRLEMCLVGLPSGAFYVLSGALGDLVAGALLLWLGGGVVAAPRARRSLERRLYVARVKRRWGRAVRFSGLATEDDRIPQAREVRPITSGDRLRVLVPRGTAVSDLEARAEVIAATLGCGTCA